MFDVIAIICQRLVWTYSIAISVETQILDVLTLKVFLAVFLNIHRSISYVSIDSLARCDFLHFCLQIWLILGSDIFYESKQSNFFLVGKNSKNVKKFCSFLVLVNSKCSEVENFFLKH